MTGRDHPPADFLLDCELLFALSSKLTLEQKVTQIFHLLRDPVFRYMVRALKNEQEAEDLTQEVFLRLYISLQEGNSFRNTRAWVFRVAHNLAVDQHKKKTVLGPFNLTLEDGALDPAPGIEQHLLQKDRNQRLQRALAQLSTQEKECLDLRAEGLTYHEIAEILEMRPPTLVKYMGRIIKKLAHEMNDDKLLSNAVRAQECCRG